MVRIIYQKVVTHSKSRCVDYLMGLWDFVFCHEALVNLYNRSTAVVLWAVGTSGGARWVNDVFWRRKPAGSAQRYLKISLSRHTVAFVGHRRTALKLRRWLRGKRPQGSSTWTTYTIWTGYEVARRREGAEAPVASISSQGRCGHRFFTDWSWR